MTPIRMLPAAAIAFALAAAPLAHAGETPVQATVAPVETPAGPLTFGTPVTVKKAVDLGKLEKKPARFTGKTVKLEGTVKEVCQGRGCWIEIEGANGATFLAKSLDESVLVPMDVQGWKVIVQGVVTKLNAKGHEGHQGHSHEPGVAAHSCPAPSYVVATQGVELKPAGAPADSKH
jgi:hypothetical protein